MGLSLNIGNSLNFLTDIASDLSQAACLSFLLSMINHI